MKINNETKVGLLTVGALAILIIGFNFLKGKDVFNRTTKIYAVFTKLGSLAKSNEVKINGYTIGTVYAFEPTNKNVDSIKVTISVTQDVLIPDNSIAYISAGLLGTSNITIEKHESNVYLKDGDYMKTREDPGIFGDLPSQAGSTLANVRVSLDSLKVVFSNLNKVLDGNTKGNLQQAIANMAAATSSLTKLLDPEKSTLAITLRNASSVSENLRKNNDSITATINNAKQFSEKLSRLNMEQTMDTLQSAIMDLKKTIAKLSSNQGTLGALINDKKLYNKLNDVLLSAEILMDDLRAHPKRYVNFSVFGKKDKGGALTSPSKKDTIP
ncbi:MAG: MCE family protein [Bacteroidetes bacterium]|jgi:phospholipid/cholesterol/gamma-HCH transport system substrate-binding protein|nr:MAG: MCE family protein [Bacteroidota bacterium]